MSALTALLARGAGDTTSGVIAGSTPQKRGLYGTQKVVKAKVADLTTVLDGTVL